MELLDLSSLASSDDPTEVLAHTAASASCLPVVVTCIPGEAELSNDFHPSARIFVAHQGRGSRWYRQGSRILQMRTEPGMIEIYEKGQAFDHCRWSGESGRCVLIEFDDANVQAITHGDMQTLRLRTHHEVFDTRVSRIVFELAREALACLPNGHLYVQGLSVSLLGLLDSGPYAVNGSQRSPVRKGQLRPTQQRRLVDFIRSGLGSDLSLTRLADELGMSPYYFARVFKESFGTTPHAYVQDCRLQGAAAALRKDSDRSIADIALAYGFASQSHMTELMRRKLGATPRAIRLDC